MKKLTLIMLSALMLSLTACSSKEEAQNVAKKIESGQTLSKSDYTVILDYLGDFATKAQPLQDKINNADSPTPELDSQLAELRADYPLVDRFNQTIQKANPDLLGADNMALLNRYAPLEWFTAPTWFTDMPDPDIAGEVVEAPTEDSNGVIAGAVDKVEKVVP